MAKGGARNHAGRKRKPTEIKIVQGTFREDRHGDEVRVPAAWPDAPAWLNPRERDLWGALKERCAAWVAPSDWLALNGIVSLMDRLLTLQEAEAKGEDTTDRQAKLWTALRGYIGITGLSPVDRAKVQAPEAEAPANPLDRFVNRAR